MCYNALNLQGCIGINATASISQSAFIWFFVSYSMYLSNVSFVTWTNPASVDLVSKSNLRIAIQDVSYVHRQRLMMVDFSSQQNIQNSSYEQLLSKSPRQLRYCLLKCRWIFLINYKWKR